MRFNGLSMRAAGLSAAVLATAVCGEAWAGIGPGMPINMNVFGGNQNFANYDNLMNHTPFAALVEALGINNMRYVGGSPSSFWDWQDGNFIPEPEITAIWSSPWFVTNGANDWVNSQPAGTFTPDRMNSFSQLSNTTPQWVANVTTREADQPAFIQYLHDQGYNYDYVEMDNETYFWGNEFAPGGAAGRNYALRFKPTSQLIRSLNPNAKIGAVMREQGIFTDEPLVTGGWNGNWNNELYGELYQPDMNDPLYDAYILHHYTMDGNRLDNYSMANVPKAFLAYPQATMKRAARVIEQNYGDLPVWITEYNVIAYNDTDPATSPQETWIRNTANTGWNALYQASFLLTALTMPDDFTVMNVHNVMGTNGWQLGSDLSTLAGQINATGQVFAHISQIARGADTVHVVEPDINPSLFINIEGEGDNRVFQAVGFENVAEQELVLVVINRDGVDQTFFMAEYGGYQNYEIWTYEAQDPGATGNVSVYLADIVQPSGSPLTPAISSGTVNPLGLFFQLPEYSLSVITLSNPIVSLAGDLNGDGFVGIDDLNLILSNWNQSVPPGDPAADPSGDGFVGIDDLNEVLGNWNAGTPPNASAAIPEPATLVLFVTGCVFGLRRR